MRLHVCGVESMLIMNQEKFNMVDFRKFKGASNLDVWKVKMNALLKENGDGCFVLKAWWFKQVECY